MLQYLKTMFDCVLIISHLDVLKDMVDHVIEIERDQKGFAKICY